jgi:hypothetical protein
VVALQISGQRMAWHPSRSRLLQAAALEPGTYAERL